MRFVLQPFSISVDVAEFVIDVEEWIAEQNS